MNLALNLIESPFVLELKNEDGLVTHLDAAPSIGGKQKGLRPMELLAGSLAGCMSIDILLILQKQRLTVTHYNVAINAKRRDTVPSSFEEIHLVFEVNTEVPLDKLENAIKLSHEKYCSVSASLDASIRITTSAKHLTA